MTNHILNDPFPSRSAALTLFLSVPQRVPCWSVLFPVMPAPAAMLPGCQLVNGSLQCVARDLEALDAGVSRSKSCAAISARPRRRGWESIQQMKAVEQVLLVALRWLELC